MREDLYIESVLAKCEALKKSGIWTPEPHLRPAAWLQNFADLNERLLAAVLLDNFVFYSDRATDRLLLTAYNRFEDDVILARMPYQGDPHDFLASVVFTPVEGEEPRPTDSGKTLCRKLRDLVELGDDRFVDPPLALANAISGRPVVFVDDFIGSGQQLIKTWKRNYVSGPIRSFEGANAARPFPALCLALIATETGLRNVSTEASAIIVVATHTLENTYSARELESPSLTPPIPDFKVALRAFLARHAVSLTLAPFLQKGEQPIYGFHELGLLFAFQHGVPDSTVPLLWALGPGEWIRLVKR